MKSKLTLLSLVLVVAAGLTAAGYSTADEKQEFKASCPMSGKPAKEDAFVEYKGKKVYFCCPGCPSAFEKDPKAVAAKVHHQWLQTGQMVQVACPFSGKPVNPEASCEVGGVKVAFCCNNCKGKVEKAAADEQVNLCCKDIAKGYTLQTTCPLSGKPINVAVAVEHEGKKVYFCCPGCPSGFEKDPSKYLSKLPQFAEEKEEKKE